MQKYSLEGLRPARVAGGRRTGRASHRVCVRAQARDDRERMMQILKERISKGTASLAAAVMVRSGFG